jgi:hypothetical protein
MPGFSKRFELGIPCKSAERKLWTAAMFAVTQKRFEAVCPVARRGARTDGRLHHRLTAALWRLGLS